MRTVAFFFFAAPAFLQAQTLTIKDHKSGEPIELVSLISAIPDAYATTNDRGQAPISDFKGSQRMTIYRMGYKTLVTRYSDLESAGFQIFLERAPLQKTEVVVSGTRWRQTTNDVPSEISTIFPSEVSLQNPQTAADLLEISGRVFVQKSQQGGGSPMIRGFATHRLLYAVDGVRMNNAIFRGGNIQNVISLDPYATESTEVLFGPGSVIYGSDAIGGVMSFQTLTPHFSYSEDAVVTGRTSARTASANDEQTGHFDVNVGWGRWAMITSITSFDFDHLKQGSHGPKDYVKPYFVQRQNGSDVVITQVDPLLQIPSAYSQTNLMQKIRFQPHEAWDLQFGFHLSETSNYGRYDRHNRVRQGAPRYGEWSYGPQKWMMNNLTLAHDAEHAVADHMTVRLACQAFEESRMDRNFNDVQRHVRVEQVDAYSVNLDLVKEMGPKHTLYYGIEWVNNDVTSTGTDEDILTGTRTRGPSRYPQATWSSQAVYLNDQFRYSPQLTFQGGLRYNAFQLDADFDTSFYPLPLDSAKISDDALTGSVGAVFRKSEHLSFSTNLATAFRSPNVDDMGKVFDSEPGAVVVPNPDLEAEYAYNTDLGLAWILRDRIRVDLNAYYTHLKNAMVRRDFTLNGQDTLVYDGVLSRVQAIQNAARAEVYGFQAGLEVKMPAQITLTSDFNVQKGEEELDDGSVSPSRHAAPWFGTTRLMYDTDKLSLQLYAQYQGRRSHDDLAVEEQGKEEIYALDDDGKTYAPSWVTLNLKSLYRLTPLFNLSAGIENITDQRYRPYSSGISGPGRSFILSIDANF